MYKQVQLQNKANMSRRTHFEGFPKQKFHASLQQCGTMETEFILQFV